MVHVIPQKSLDWKGLEVQLQELKTKFDHVLGVKPTGWTHSTGTGFIFSIGTGCLYSTGTGCLYSTGTGCIHSTGTGCFATIQ